MNKLITGGATGADAYFAEIAYRNGHRVYHYSFDSHKVQGPGEIVILCQETLNSADAYINQCNKILERSIGHLSLFSKNLIRRNMIKLLDNDVKNVYAVGWFKDGEVDGGTAWAVVFSILTSKNVYFYDQHSKFWYEKDLFNSWVKIETPPKPYGIYAGIGSRKLTTNGKSVIRLLFGETV